MRVVVQRVSSASVRVSGEIVGSVGVGLCLLVGVGHEDGPDEIQAAVEKIAGLRIFPDEAGKMNLSVTEVGGAVLVVSQFTLLGDARRGRRPSFVAAADPDRAEPLIQLMVASFRSKGIPTEQGRFGAQMEVSIVNEGPVTLTLDFADGRTA